MTKEELEKLKETIAYFGHWYDVIGEERVLILEKSIEYIAELEKENARQKEKYDTCLRENTGLKIHSAYVEKKLTEAKAIIKIAREAYIKSGIYTMNSEPVYKEEVERLYALFFDRAEAFLNKEQDQ